MSSIILARTVAVWPKLNRKVNRWTGRQKGSEGSQTNLVHVRPFCRLLLTLVKQKIY